MISLKKLFLILLTLSIAHNSYGMKQELDHNELDHNEIEKKNKALLVYGKIGNLEKIQSLLVKNKEGLCANPNFQNHLGQTVLHNASRNGHKEVVEFLLENKADHNIQDNCGEKPLYWAAENNHKEVVKILLLKDKTDHNIQDKYGKTHLSRATENGHLEIVKLLLENKANPNIPNNNENKTPLYFATDNGQQEIVQLLLENKADSNIQDQYGYTPLCLAAFQNHKEIVKLLLENKANPSIQTNYGQTPLHIAAEKGFQNCVNELLSLISLKKEHLTILEITGIKESRNFNKTISQSKKIVEEKGNLLIAKNKHNKIPYDVAATEEIKKSIKKTMINIGIWTEINNDQNN